MKKEKRIILQAAVCLTMLGGCLFSYLEKQNELMQLRIAVPKLVQGIQVVQEENVRYRYQIQEFESPDHLMSLISDPKFNLLKYPLSKEVLVLEEAPRVDLAAGKQAQYYPLKLKHTLAVGAR